MASDLERFQFWLKSEDFDTIHPSLVPWSVLNLSHCGKGTRAGGIAGRSASETGEATSLASAHRLRERFA